MSFLQHNKVAIATARLMLLQNNLKNVFTDFMFCDIFYCDRNVKIYDEGV